MIVDKLSNLELYKELIPQILLVKKFINDHKNLKDLECRKYLIDEENVFANVQQYVTKSSNENKWETHRKYIDVQLIISGNENIGYAPFDTLTLVDDFKAENDIAFYEGPKNYTDITLSEGMFAIFYPEEGHLPCCITETASTVKKIVFKIRKT